MFCFKQILEATSQETVAVRQISSYLLLDEQDIRDTVGQARTNS